jgi:hypothetical protein
VVSHVPLDTLGASDERDSACAGQNILILDGACGTNLVNHVLALRLFPAYKTNNTSCQRSCQLESKEILATSFLTPGVKPGRFGLETPA